MPGLYSLVFKSVLPSTDDFQNWVTRDVLPSIRKHGAYMTLRTPEEILQDPDFIIQLATNLKNERLKKQEAEQQIEIMKPHAVLGQAITVSKRTILICKLAKLLKQSGVKIGADRLFSVLREKGYLVKSGSYKNMPTQKSMELGLFEIKETIISGNDGVSFTSKTPKVTGKGQEYFINKFLLKWK